MSFESVKSFVPRPLMDLSHSIYKFRETGNYKHFRKIALKVGDIGIATLAFCSGYSIVGAFLTTSLLSTKAAIIFAGSVLIYHGSVALISGVALSSILTFGSALCAIGFGFFCIQDYEKKSQFIFRKEFKGLFDDVLECKSLEDVQEYWNLLKGIVCFEVI